ncbi:MAG: hypothetical protein KIT84_29380 [Labilithrix sp.]|nr:hypothetical protein [Labilithrix sp.]MCW5815175.1 hypothetical protein [Labilithrix sp.]
MRSWLSLSAALLVTLAAAPASANSGGVKGYSGKSASCKTCHNGGAAPTVTLDGPSSLAAGASGDYTLTVKTELTKGSAGISADGATLTAGENLKVTDGELTQTGPIDVAGGEVVFSFKVKAPSSGSSFKIYAAGLGSDGVNITGDGDATTTKSVSITGGGGGGGGDDEDDDDSSSSSSSSSSKKTSSGDDDDDYDTGIPNSGCAAAGSHLPDMTSALVVVAALALASKRRRKP